MDLAKQIGAVKYVECSSLTQVGVRVTRNNPLWNFLVTHSDRMSLMKPYELPSLQPTFKNARNGLKEQKRETEAYQLLPYFQRIQGMPRGLRLKRTFTVKILVLASTKMSIQVDF